MSILFQIPRPSWGCCSAPAGEVSRPTAPTHPPAPRGVLAALPLQDSVAVTAVLWFISHIQRVESPYKSRVRGDQNCKQ